MSNRDSFYTHSLLPVPNSHIWGTHVILSSTVCSYLSYKRQTEVSSGQEETPGHRHWYRIRGTYSSVVVGWFYWVRLANTVTLFTLCWNTSSEETGSPVHAHQSLYQIYWKVTQKFGLIRQKVYTSLVIGCSRSTFLRVRNFSLIRFIVTVIVLNCK